MHMILAYGRQGKELSAITQTTPTIQEIFNYTILLYQNKYKETTFCTFLFLFLTKTPCQLKRNPMLNKTKPRKFSKWEKENLRVLKLQHNKAIYANKLFVWQYKHPLTKMHPLLINWLMVKNLAWDASCTKKHDSNEMFGTETIKATKVGVVQHQVSLKEVDKVGSYLSPCPGQSSNHLRSPGMA